MTVQSWKTISQNSLDLERTQALKMGDSHLGNKMADIKKFFSEVVPLDPKQTLKTEDNILNRFAVMRKSRR